MESIRHLAGYTVKSPKVTAIALPFCQQLSGIVDFYEYISFKIKNIFHKHPCCLDILKNDTIYGVTVSVKMIIEDVLNTLQQRKTNLCCKDVTTLLESLGFEVRDANRGGHKVFTHRGLPSFKSSSFNCGHGKNPEIKPAYIGKIIKIIHQYDTELQTFLEKQT